MGEPDRDSDIERLIRETDAVLGHDVAPRQQRATGRVDDQAAGYVASVRSAVGAATVAAAVVGAVFALLPFLGMASGAAGAFLATFVAVLLLRRR